MDVHPLSPAFSSHIGHYGVMSSLLCAMVGRCRLSILYTKVEVRVAQSCPTLCDPGTIQSMTFSRPEHWSG